jgi:REP element-mobilizing transposase RayT
VAYFKHQSSKRINNVRDTPGIRLWQRNYYDHVIRDDADLDRIREYIATNPLRWELDQLHPDNRSQW